MSVLLNKREETPFAARDVALDMRRQITELSFRRFGKKPRKLPNTPSNWTDWSKDSQDKWLTSMEEKRLQAEQFDNWFIDNERNILDRLLRKLIFDIDQANIMRPQYIFECDKQRELQDEAIGICSNIKRELNYIADTIPSNKNFIVKTIEIIEREMNLLRGWRQSCNKIRKDIESKGNL